ncbi:hypothetical protein NPIL_656381, partial [Nephila pilipes]
MRALSTDEPDFGHQGRSGRPTEDYSR